MESDATCSDVLGKPKLRRISVRKEIQEWTEDEQNDTRAPEPVTPAGRVFSQPFFDCYILVIFRLKTRLNVEAIITGLQSTLIKHKRFSSVMRRNKDGVLFWVPAQVNISDHVVVPSITVEDNETPGFVENYAAKLASAPRMDPSRPLWEIHLLDVESGEEAAASAVMRVHHSLGDGVSLMSLFLSCTRKSGDPDSLPTIPRPSRAPRNPFSFGAVWGILLVLWYTLVDVLYFVGTLLWIKDSDTPIKGFQGMESSPKQIVHETLSLQDIKIVKNAIKGTVNDVLLGITSAGILTYLERKYEEGKGEVVKERKQRKENHGDSSGKGMLPSKLRIRSTILVNTRASPGIHELAEMMKSGKEARWGNNLGYVILSLPMVKHENPLEYVHEASVIFGRKKLSMEAPLTYASGTVVLKLLGDKAAARLTHNMVANTTFSYSNMMGPVEEIEFFGHPIIDILPTVTGHPHALTMHFQSYLGKLTLVMSASTAVIGDPKQLCLDCVNAFHSMKKAAEAASKTT